MVRQMALLDTVSNQGTGASPAFARHETFHPRFGWLKKGFDAAVRDQHIFTREEAPVILGVGKNMARSIRYWCEAFKVLTKDDSPTEFGEQLLGNEGWDPYLEDPASLWLLHWKLLQPPCIATAWWITFNYFRQVEFTVDDLANTISDYCVPLSRSVASSSIRKDITCILRMYTSQTVKSGPTEDTIDCPFAELGMIQSTGESKHYTFRNGFKPNLPAEIILAACMEFIGGDKSQGTVSISRLLYEPNSPGLVFKLTESVLCEAIESVAKKVTSIQLSDSAGLLQLSFTDSPATLAGSILGRYYQTSRNLPLSVGVL